MLKRKPWCWLILLALFTSSALAEDVTFIEKGPDQITDEPITLKVFASVKPNIEDMATNLQTPGMKKLQAYTSNGRCLPQRIIPLN